MQESQLWEGLRVAEGEPEGTVPLAPWSHGWIWMAKHKVLSREHKGFRRLIYLSFLYFAESLSLLFEKQICFLVSKSKEQEVPSEEFLIGETSCALS